MNTNVRTLARLGTSSLALLCISILGETASAQITTVRVSVKRVLGHSTQGATTPAAASPVWNLACTSGAPCTSNTACAGSAFDANVIQRANLILAPNFLPANQAGIRLELVEFVDVLDPGYPASMFDVDLGLDSANFARGKIALEAAAELQPGRYGFNATAINVYLVNTLFSSSPTNPFSGFCSFPSPFGAPQSGQNDDIIFLSGAQVSSVCSTANTDTIAQTLAHEIGHYFGLFHTSETSFGVEGATSCFGSAANCATAGDMVCDTPADPNNITTLGLLYGIPGACPASSTAFATLRDNVMSGYTKPSFFFNTLTPGQRQRISMNGSGSFLNLRNHVFSTSVSPVITSVVQTSPNTIFITGTNLSGPYPGPGTLAQWRATLGSPIASGVGTGAVCVSDIAPSSFTGTAPTTSMTAVFPNAIPPGRHDVCLTRAYLNGGGVPSAEEVIAVLQNAVPVTPYIDLDVINATAGAALLTIQTTGPSQPILLGFGEFTPTPPVVVMTNPYSVLLLNPSPSLVLSNLVSGPTGFASIGIVFSGLPAGGPAGPNSFHGAQAIDLGAAAGASPVTNAIAVRVP